MQQIHVVDGNLVRRAFHLSDMGQAQGTNNTPSPPSDIRKDRCLGYKVSFGTNISRVTENFQSLKITH